MKNKLEIQKLEDARKRVEAYVKRNAALLNELKRVEEPSDLAFLTFSPDQSGNPTLYTNSDNDLTQAVLRLSRLSVEEKCSRKSMTDKALRKCILSNHHKMDSDTTNSIDQENSKKELEEEMNNLQKQLDDTEKRLRPFIDPSDVNDFSQLNDIEIHLSEKLHQLQQGKSTTAPRRRSSKTTNETNLQKESDANQIASTSKKDGDIKKG